ncbi:YebC/PmpR family DNA-binding transcriptional regulator [bacterium]|nr:YebC/PmpR family DNA-binding transcriptional regulator [bacterium]
MGRGWIHGKVLAVGAKKGKLFTKLAREITIAAKTGGAIADNNPRLKMALQEARKNSMPRDTIERALNRATGDGQEGAIEELTYEGYGPHGVAMLVETQTDNKNRTVQDLRAIFVRGDGNLGEPGSVMWMFDRVGSIIAEKEGFSGDPEEAAIEAGADDVEPIEETTQFRFISSVESLFEVKDALEAASWEVEKAELSYKPKTPMEITDEQEKDLIELVDKLNDHDDVKTIHLAL